MAMEVKFAQRQGKIELFFTKDEDDGVYNDRVKMDRTTVITDYGKNLALSEIHPDHLALASLLMANPFVKKELRLPFKISKRFFDAAKKISKFKLIPSEGFIEPYKATNNSRPSLSFSGGADSTAALLLMPKNTLSVFLDRPLKFARSLYNKSAAYATIEHAKSEGYEVKKIHCDLEYIRSPIGFPTDLATSVPLILMAAKENLDSVAFGTVLESAYRVGHETCRDYKQSGHYKVWGGLFEAAGIPLYLPVAGISEVGTSQIVMNSSFYDYTRSCIRGKFPKPCLNCWKCFRKSMVDNRLKSTKVSNREMQKWLKVREVKRKLAPHPISHENVLSWSLQGGNVQGETKDLLMNRMEGKIRNMDFLTDWYSPSIELVPERYRQETTEKIRNYLVDMDEKYHEQITGHKMTEWLNSEEAKDALAIFSKLIQ